MYGPYQAIIDSDLANQRDNQSFLQALQSAAQIQGMNQEREQSAQAFPLLQRSRELINEGRQTTNEASRLQYDLDQMYAPRERQTSLAATGSPIVQRLPEHFNYLASVIPQIPSAARMSALQDYIKRNGLESFIQLEETDPEALPVKLAAIRDEMNQGALRSFMKQMEVSGAMDRATLNANTRLRTTQLGAGNRGGSQRRPSQFEVLFNAKRAVQDLIRQGVPPDDPRYVEAYETLAAAEGAAVGAKGPTARPGTPDLSGMGVPVTPAPSLLNDIPRPGAAAPSIPAMPAEFREAFKKRYKTEPTEAQWQTYWKATNK